MPRPLLALLVLLALPARAAAQETDRLLWVGGTAAVAAALLLDEAVDEGLPAGGGERLQGFTAVLNYGGRPQVALPVVGAVWAVGELGDRPELARSAVRVGGGLLAAGVASGALKFALGRERPSV